MAKTKPKTTKKVGKNKKSARPVARKKMSSSGAGRTATRKAVATSKSVHRKSANLLERATQWIAKFVGVALIVGGMAVTIVTITRVDVQQVSEKGTPRAESLPPTSERIRHYVDWTQNTSKAQLLAELNAKVQASAASVDIRDNAPLIPPAFNCTTYVETIVALSRAISDADFVSRLLEVRYKDATPTFGNRNHFPSIDWIPNNVSAGVLREVTAEVASASGASVAVAEKSINRWQWYLSRVKDGAVDRSIASIEGFEQEWNQSTLAQVPYLPHEQFASFERQIPDGAIVNIVHLSKEGIPVLISHQGFVLRNERDGALYFKHSSPQGELKSEKLENYLRRASSRKNWPAVGININVISDSV